LRPFEPGRWLRNRHFQSIYPSLPLQRWFVRRRATPLLAASTPILLDCGDGVRLQAFHAAPSRPDGRLVVLLHGWEGSANAAYVLSLGQDLFAAGSEVVRLNLRDHGDTQHLNRGLFHSCLLQDVAGAIKAIRQQYPGREFWLVGFSLGGNFMLRAAALPVAVDWGLGGVIAVSPVLDPARTLSALEREWVVYRRYFVAKWSASLRRKQQIWPEDHDFNELLRFADLRRMTAELVVRNTEYGHIDDYLQGYAITGRRLETLSAPSVILTAEDDPIIPVEDLARLAKGPNLHLHVTQRGGHTGFLEKLGRPSWANHFVLETMASGCGMVAGGMGTIW
jgi:predicted alpha/beta-fold hydrolase